MRISESELCCAEKRQNNRQTDTSESVLLSMRNPKKGLIVLAIAQCARLPVDKRNGELGKAGPDG